MRKSELMVPAVVLIIIGVVVGFLILGGSDLLGLSAADVNTLITLLPGVFVLLVAFYAVSVSRGYMLAGSVSGVGLAFAFLINQLNSANLLIPDLEISVTDLQILIIIVFLVIGVALAVRER